MDDGTPFRVRVDGEAPEQAVSLAPLSPDHVRLLADDLVGGAVSEVLAAFLCNNAGGNPYFAQEIVAYWLEDNQTHVGEDTGVTSPSVFLLPNDVNSLLIARLDRLQPHVKKVIQAASVLGREFDLRILTAMLNRDTNIQEIVRTGEEQCIWSALSEMRYQFSNVLLRNAAYEMQSRARLVDLHRRAAEGIEAVYAEDLDGREVELGRHWQRAGEPDHARRYYLAGARKAVERYAHSEARRLYRAYFKLTADPTPESVIVRYELARDVLEVQGRSQEALQEHFKVLDEAMKIGDRDSEALGLLGLGRVHAATGRAEGARAFYEQALALAREAESPWIEGLAIAKLAFFHKEQGRLDVACTLAEQALVIARNVHNRKEELNLLDALATLHREQGQLDLAASLAEQAQAIEREIGLG
jgi:tetratricopeptide (TPR) repeat protein